MRTPGNDEELATGFLFTEGIIKEPTAVHSAIIPEENKVLVQLSENAVPALQQADRNFYTTSSCGVCGKTSIDAIKTVSAFSEAKTAITVNASHLYSLPENYGHSKKFLSKRVAFMHLHCLMPPVIYCCCAKTWAGIMLWIS